MARTIPTLTLDDARALIAAGEAKAEQLGVPYNIAVVDAGGNLLAFVRMDDAWLGSIDIAIHKAYTARAFDMTTEDLGSMATPKKPLFGIQNTNNDRIVIFGGGAPIKHGETVIGAIGASGGTVDQDVEVVEAMTGSYEEERRRAPTNA
ncbi:GlcG/HbpS family heme-binding protein [Sphingomonas oryzagri]